MTLPESRPTAAPDPQEWANPPHFTVGPNPHLTAFVEAHRTGDEREPLPAFTQTQTASKASALYNMHTYWSKKPHEAIAAYVRHYTRPGDLVLDPFSGSGGTSVAALLEGRKAVAVDLSPAAAFISYHYTHPVHPDRLRAGYDRLLKRVGPELEWLYETELDGVKARTQYTVYSESIKCPQCSADIVVFDAPEVSVPKLDRKGNAVLKNNEPVVDSKLGCSGCSFTFTTRELSKYERLAPVPVKVSVQGANGRRVERRPNEADLARLQQIALRELPHWFPRLPMPRGERYYKDGLGPRKINSVDQLFSKRNLWALAALLAAIAQEADSEVRLALLFAFTGVVLGMSRMNQYRPEVSFPVSLMKGTYYLPVVSKELYVEKELRNKV